MPDIQKFDELSVNAEEEEKAKGYSTTSTSRDGNGLPYTFVRPWPPIARGTIPHCMALLAVIDYVGYLVKTNDDNYHKTEDNIIEFFKLSADYGIYIPTHSDEVLLINRCARQGIVHNYFPKLDLEVSFHSTNPNGKLLFKSPQTQNIVLNINELQRVVEKTLDAIFQDPDVARHNNMENHYLKAINDYEANVGSLIRDIKSFL